MKRLLPLVLLLAACTSTPEYPPPQADKAQVVIKVTATPKVGVQGPRTEGQYDKESVEKGRRFTRVNYSEMDCIAVVVEGPGTEPGRSKGGRHVLEDYVTIEIGNEGFQRDLSIANLYYELGASIRFANARDKPLTLFGCTQGSDSGAFDLMVPARSSATVTLSAEGMYDIYCDEDERLFCQVLATKSAVTAICQSGADAFFDGLAPGTYDVRVYAPRLPPWKAKVTTAAGKRETLYAELTVNSLPKAK